jgi:hypothetical protein
MKSCLHPLPLDVVGFDSIPARFIESLEGIPPFFFPKASPHDSQQNLRKGEGRIMLKALVGH